MHIDNKLITYYSSRSLYGIETGKFTFIKPIPPCRNVLADVFPILQDVYRLEDRLECYLMRPTRNQKKKWRRKQRSNEKQQQAQEASTSKELAEIIHIDPETETTAEQEQQMVGLSDGHRGLKGVAEHNQVEPSEDQARVVQLPILEGYARSEMEIGQPEDHLENVVECIQPIESTGQPPFQIYTTNNFDLLNDEESVPETQSQVANEVHTVCGRWSDDMAESEEDDPCLQQQQPKTKRGRPKGTRNEFDIEDLKAQASLVKENDVVGMKGEMGSIESFGSDKQECVGKDGKKGKLDVRRVPSFSGPLMLPNCASANSLSAPIRSSGVLVFWFRGCASKKVRQMLGIGYLIPNK
ncbi:hypothetical protein IFM89_019169, partial [Coptis chinensis]